MGTLDDRIMSAAMEWNKEDLMSSIALADVIHKHLVPDGAKPVEVAVAWGFNEESKIAFNCTGWTGADWASIRDSSGECIEGDLLRVDRATIEGDLLRVDRATIYLVPPKIDVGEDGVGFSA